MIEKRKVNVNIKLDRKFSSKILGMPVNSHFHFLETNQLKKNSVIYCYGFYIAFGILFYYFIILFNVYLTDSLSLKSINTTIPFLVFLSVKVSKHVLSPFFP